MIGSISYFLFVVDGKELFSIGGDGEVYYWDLRIWRCIYKVLDEGCVKNMVLQVLFDSKIFVMGLSVGVVNLYNRESFFGGVWKLLKVFMNLIMFVDNLRFSFDLQILVISFCMKKDLVCLIYVLFQMVFLNWFILKILLQYVYFMVFSLGGGYFVIGNGVGKVLLFRFCYYDYVQFCLEGSS